MGARFSILRDSRWAVVAKGSWISVEPAGPKGMHGCCGAGEWMKEMVWAFVKWDMRVLGGPTI